MGQSLLTALVIVVLCGTASSVAASRMLRQTGNQAEFVASGTGPAGGAYYSGAFDPARAASFYYCRVYGPDGYGIVLPSGTTCYFAPDPAASYNGPVGAAGYGGATRYGRAFLPASAASNVRASDPTGAASNVGDSGPGGVAASNNEPGFSSSQSASGLGTASGLAAAAAAILRAQLGDPQNY